MIAPLARAIALIFRSTDSCVSPEIDRRTKISGAQWNEKNVPQVLAH